MRGKLQDWLAQLAQPLLLILGFIWVNLAFNYWSGLSNHLWSGTLAAASTVLGSVIYLPTYLLGRKRYRYMYLVFVGLAVALVFTAQLINYRQHSSLMRASALRQTGYVSSVAPAIRARLSPEMIFFLTPLLLVFLPYPRSTKKVKPAIALSTLAVASSVLFINRQQHFIQAYSGPWLDTIEVSSKVGVAWFSLLDAARDLRRNRPVTDDERQLVASWAANRTPEAGRQNFGLLKDRNLIIFQIESLEQWVVGRKVGGQDITPTLNQLTTEGLYFENYFYQSYTGPTADAEFALMTSLQPLVDSVAFVDYSKREYYGLPRLLAENAYNTAAFHGDKASFWNRGDIYPELGYQRFYDVGQYTIPRSVGWGLSDHDFVEQTLPKLQQLPQPFMASVITITSHIPYELPADLQYLTLPADLNLSTMQKNYLQAVNYADKALGQFIAGLKQAGLYNNSLIVVVGDHTAGVFKPGDMGMSRFLGTSLTGYDYTRAVQVPMLLLAPGSELSGRSSVPASHMDVYPTVANLLGITYPRSVLGNDLFNAQKPIIARRSMGPGLETVAGTDYIYHANGQTEYNKGVCLEATTRTPVEIDKCRPMYDQQLEKTRVSDLLVKGNLFWMLNN